jgi:hypothetical protein
VTGKRIGAVVVAIALIAGAFLLRNNVLEGDDADDPPGSTTTTTQAAAEAGELVCISELRAVCQALRADHPDLRIDVQDAGTTLDALAVLPDDAPRPLWLTIEPFPAMLDALRTANGLQAFGATPDAVGASQLAIATSAARAADLTAGCADVALWSCIGANAGNDWSALAAGTAGGRIRPSLGVVDRQAAALASFAAAVAGYFGRPDIRSSDWQGDPAFTPWVSRLLGGVDPSALTAGTPLATMAIRPSALDIAATTTAELTALGGDTFVANYPEPAMWVEAVVAVPEGTAAPTDLVTATTAALSAAGWDAPGAATQALPGPTTMLALRALWQESTT